MKQYGRRPAKGTVAAALVVLERLRGDCRLTLDAHLAEGGAQIAGLSLPALRKILERFAERRDFPSEGGRTNRGNNKAMRVLLESLSAAGFAAMPRKKRNACIDEMQGFLVESLDAYYKLERIRFDFDSGKPARAIVGEILAKAEERSQSGPVAQHLVGAKLAIRFPDHDIGNYAYSAADDQAGRSGDFRVGTTAFHVTVAPSAAHADRCARNLREGLGAFLIVTDSKVDRARVLLEIAEVADRVAVESIQSFVGQNLSELATFNTADFPGRLGQLLQEYNRRVSQVETDNSLLIEIPATLSDRE